MSVRQRLKAANDNTIRNLFFCKNIFFNFVALFLFELKYQYMKRVSILFFGLIMSIALFAESPVITFKTTTHDFGKIKEQDGLVTKKFEFKNTGDAPLIIRVQASCGCTATSWTKEPVLPGKTGSVTASYNPVNRPGTFIKSISVYTNADSKPIQLTIKGDVIPKPAVPQ